MFMPLHVLAYDCWAPGAAGPESWLAWRRGGTAPTGNEPPALKQIKPMQRRRLSLQARAAYEVAGRCLEHLQESEREGLQSVFASAHGQCAATLKMLETLARSEQLSPAAFSISVHNAIAGQFSISHQLTGASTSLSPGRDGLGGVFLEALGQLAQGAAHTLVCCLEEPVPGELAPYEENPPTALAAAFLLARDPTPGTRTVQMSRGVGTGAPPLPFWAQAAEFVCFLQAGTGQLNLDGGPTAYRWGSDVGG